VASFLGALTGLGGGVVTVGPHVKPVCSETFPFARILFATDFTSAAAKAAIYAVTFAEVFGAKIDKFSMV
jgi:hypothetical protein